MILACKLMPPLPVHTKMIVKTTPDLGHSHLRLRVPSKGTTKQTNPQLVRLVCPRNSSINSARGRRPGDGGSRSLVQSCGVPSSGRLLPRFPVSTTPRPAGRDADADGEPAVGAEPLATTCTRNTTGFFRGRLVQKKFWDKIFWGCLTAN